MSSYTISKREYMKAAGFCAGLAECKNQYREAALRIWCDKLGKVAGDEEYRKTFEALYKWNAESVAIQYGDEEAESDPNDYRAEFLQGKAAAKKAYSGWMVSDLKDLERLILGFNNFASSVNYQIDDEERNRKANQVLAKIEHHLTALWITKAGKGESTRNFWGSFELEPEAV